ncbi:RagB/SusD family nutrient uptake outer membrane protein [Chryseobacterium sp. G0186]|uniref:RagB/SusD family nutrient uptake outer membrane protein n=1 Tax=Chryseobacterium sp. G0186 TaxID=2487064 RepID=UPI000F4E1547|nr:RagB/SusD family nutrient uptake outer membrane protein [Chryseobacterium sp. G0186]AZA78962.1 RagB/SusD family nutrient uptake outer membrane protein [Chryseobacterium sp. G0186]
MKKIFGILFCSTIILTGCSKDYLDTDLKSTINQEQIDSSPAALQGLVNGVYTSLHTYGLSESATHEAWGHKAVLSAMDMMSNDMLNNRASWFSAFYNYTARIQTSVRTTMVWNTYYQQIRAVNTVIASIEKTGVTPQNKAIYGQALALRGYMHFMLARVFGPTYVGHLNADCIPVYTEVTLVGKTRSNVDTVYKQIVKDLTDSLPYLVGYVRENKEKVDTRVAKAFLAEIYLEMGNYAGAATMAHDARTGVSQPTEAQWLDGFYDLEASPDAIWGGIISEATTSFVASFFAHFDNTDPNGYAVAFNKLIDRRLYDAMPATDFRKKAFQSANNAAPYNGTDGVSLPKYASLKFIDKSVGQGGDYIYMRASEMYYIEAEGLAKSGNEAGAKVVLEEITKLRNPSYTVTAAGPALIDEIILQKRIELWGEGYAWTDMKRLGVGLLRDYPGTNHNLAAGRLNIPAGDLRFTFQVPQAEILANPNVTQNP